jgi:hypothetical protein
MILPRTTPLVGTTLGLLLMAVGGSLPLFIAYFVRGTNWQFESLPVGFVIFNPFALGRTGADREIVFGFLFVWAMLALVANLPWFQEQWASFRRYELRPMPIPPAAAEPTVVHA